METKKILMAINVKPLEGNEIAPPLNLGYRYEPVQTHVCDCGQEHIDVGLESKVNFIRCHSCKKHLPEGDKVHWCHPTRFVDVTNNPHAHV
jgi:hypothetical protein